MDTESEPSGSSGDANAPKQRRESMQHLILMQDNALYTGPTSHTIREDDDHDDHDTMIPLPPSKHFVPIREECRLRRLWFFYHDIRAFTTSVGHCVDLELVLHKKNIDLGP